MQINNHNPANFKGIQADILKNIKNLPPSYQKNVLKYRRILENSSVVDLVCNKKGEIVLKTKDMITVGPRRYLPEGVELRLTPLSKSINKGAEIECTNVQIVGKEDVLVDIMMDLGSKDLAERLMKNFKFLDGYYPDKLPILGALLDISERMSEPLAAIRRCLHDLKI